MAKALTEADSMASVRGATVLSYTDENGDTISLNTAVDVTEAWVQTKALDFGDMQVKKAITRVASVFLGITGLDDMDVVVYASNTRAAEDFVEIKRISFENLTEQLAKMRTDKYLFFKLRWHDAFVTIQWQFYGFTVYGTVGGRRVA
jgi:hypothetical protein